MRTAVTYESELFRYDSQCQEGSSVMPKESQPYKFLNAINRISQDKTHQVEGGPAHFKLQGAVRIEPSQPQFTPPQGDSCFSPVSDLHASSQIEDESNRGLLTFHTYKFLNVNNSECGFSRMLREETLRSSESREKKALKGLSPLARYTQV